MRPLASALCSIVATTCIATATQAPSTVTEQYKFTNSTGQVADDLHVTFTAAVDWSAQDGMPKQWLQPPAAPPAPRPPPVLTEVFAGQAGRNSTVLNLAKAQTGTGVAPGESLIVELWSAQNPAPKVRVARWTKGNTTHPGPNDWLGPNMESRDEAKLQWASATPATGDGLLRVLIDNVWEYFASTPGETAAMAASRFAAFIQGLAFGRVESSDSDSVEFLGLSYGDAFLNVDVEILQQDSTQSVSVTFQSLPPPTAYCTAGTTSGGCVASISGTGVPSASAPSGFYVDVTGVEGNRNGLIFYGVSGPASNPWGGSSSYLCVAAPTQRTGNQDSGGTSGTCDGWFTLDFNAFIASNPGALGQPFAAGDVVDAQAWFRDPPSPKTTHLSNALEFMLQP